MCARRYIVFGAHPLSICRVSIRSIPYGSLNFTGGIGNPRTTFSYKSGGSPQSSRRRICTSVNGDNRACARPLLSTTLTLIAFIADFRGGKPTDNGTVV